MVEEEVEDDVDINLEESWLCYHVNVIGAGCPLWVMTTHIYRRSHTWKVTSVTNGTRQSGDTAPNIDDLLLNIDYTLLCLTPPSI